MFLVIFRPDNAYDLPVALFPTREAAYAYISNADRPLGERLSRSLAGVYRTAESMMPADFFVFVFSPRNWVVCDGSLEVFLILLRFPTGDDEPVRLFNTREAAIAFAPNAADHLGGGMYRRIGGRLCCAEDEDCVGWDPAINTVLVEFSPDESGILFATNATFVHTFK